MNTASARLLFLSVSMAAHAGLYLAVGSAAGKGEAQAAPRPAMTVTTVSLALTPHVEPTTENKATLTEAASPLPQPTPEPVAPAEQVASAAASPASDTAGGNEGEGAALPVLLPGEPHYFDLNELTEQPALVRDIAPEKSMVAVSNDVPRSLVLNLLINEQGGIDQVEFEGVTLPEQVQHLVSDLFSALKFQPGKRKDVAVKSRMQIEVTLQDILQVGQAPHPAGAIAPLP